MTSDVGCVTGRFQPLHHGHLELFGEVLRRHGRLIVAITNPDPSTHVPDPTHGERHLPESNPFTFFERCRFVEEALRESPVGRDRFSIVPFPLHRPELWHHYVPLEAVQYVRVFSLWERRKVELLSKRYRVYELTGTKRHSGTSIRARIEAGEPWDEDVPRSVAALAGAFLAAHRAGPHASLESRW